MADVLDYAPPPPKKPSLFGRIFFAVVVVLLLAFTAFWDAEAWRDPSPAVSDLVMDGVLTLMCGFMLLLAGLQVYLFFHPPLRRARRLLDIYRRTYSAEPDWEPVDLRQLPRMNTRFLAAQQGQFEAEGLRLLGDFENAGLRRAHPDARIGVRVMVEPGGTGIAAFFSGYHRWPIRLLLLLARKPATHRHCAQQTYLSDGRILVTQFPRANPGRSHPWYVSCEVPWNAGVAALVSRHRAELAAYLAAHPGVEILPCPTSDILIARFNDEVRRVAALYKQTGCLAPDDLRRMYGPHSAAARQLVPALEQILFEEYKAQSAAPPPDQIAP